MTNFLSTNLSFLRKREGYGQAEMQIHIGFPRSTWSNYENDISKPDIDGLIVISEFFEVSIDDLLTKDISSDVQVIAKKPGSKKSENVQLNVQPIVQPIPQKTTHSQELKITLAAEPDDLFDKKNRVVPITDLSVAAGSGIYAPEYIENVAAIRLPVAFLKKDATYLTIRIKGQSMSPTLQDGGYAIIRLLDKSEWAKMSDERIYAVCDTEGKAYLKRVKNRFKQDFIVLMSDNPDKATYGNFNLQTDEINTIWYMEWYLSAKMPNIHDQYYSRLQKLEDRVEELFKSPPLINPK